MFSRAGDGWTMLVVIALRAEPRRFNDLRRRVDGISQQMLTRTLKLLERDGIITRTVAATTPPQVEYALNDLGWSLSEAVHQLAGLAASHLATIHRNRSHCDVGR
jgi:DNA-binding HxlR family transcriptional regulator